MKVLNFGNYLNINKTNFNRGLSFQKCNHITKADTIELSEAARKPEPKYNIDGKDISSEQIVKNDNRVFYKDETSVFSNLKPFEGIVSEFDRRGEFFTKAEYQNGYKARETLFKQTRAIDGSVGYDMPLLITEFPTNERFSSEERSARKKVTIPHQGISVYRNTGEEWEKAPFIKMRHETINFIWDASVDFNKIWSDGKCRHYSQFKISECGFQEDGSGKENSASLRLYDDGTYELLEGSASYAKRGLITLKTLLADDEFRSDFGANEKINEELQKAIDCLEY